MAKVRQLWEFIKNPSKAFEKEVKTPLSEAIKYSLILQIPSTLLGAIGGIIFMLIYFSILNTIAPGEVPAMTSLMIILIIALIPVSYIQALTYRLIGILWYHLWAYLFGAKNGLETTAKVIIYGATPMHLFGWIPIINWFVMIWSAVLYYIGLTKLHGMSKRNAAFAILLAYFVPMVFIAIILIALIILLVSIPTA